MQLLSAERTSAGGCSLHSLLKAPVIDQFQSSGHTTAALKRQVACARHLRSKGRIWPKGTKLDQVQNAGNVHLAGSGLKTVLLFLDRDSMYNGGNGQLGYALN
jgi:hypothetical protein